MEEVGTITTQKEEIVTKVEGLSLLHQLEIELMNGPEVVFPLENSFPKDLWVRKIMMPAGSRAITRKHKLMHPFFILAGHVQVLKFTPDGGIEVEEEYTTGANGITAPGTQRYIRMLEDTVWACVFPNPDNIQDPDVLAELYSDGSDNPVLDLKHPRMNIWSKHVSPSIVNTLEVIEAHQQLVA